VEGLKLLDRLGDFVEVELVAR
jgi:hypothetical protein